MSKVSFLALALVAVGCSVDPEGATPQPRTPAPTEPGVTATQVRAFEALQRETSQPWSWMQHATHRTPMHLSAPRHTGKRLVGPGVSAAEATVAFVGQYRDLFKMRDAGAELSLARSEVDALAMTHVRFQQVHHGVPVVGAELAAHYDTDGRITSVDANYIPGIELSDLSPALTPARALEVVSADIVALTKDIDAARLASDDGKLVVFAQGGPAKLAYQFTVRAVFGAAPAIWITTIDAMTGAVLDRYNNLQTIEATGSGVLGDAKKFQVATTGGGYTMSDTSRGVTIATYTAGGQQIGPEQGAEPVTSTSLASWDLGTGPGAAVDAHSYAAVVFDYYKAVHARNAIDGAGGAMLSTAHFGQAYDNAFWDGTGMSYGDGGQLFKPLSAGLDVVAHEFTHGVTQNTSNLAYQGQSGALNESVSDIFGAFIEHSMKPDDAKNWTMGEAIVKQAGLLRDFKNPAAGQQPAHMSNYVNTQQDNGGVHINSGIPNNADYLMTAGGTNPVSNVAVKFGIGWAKSEKVWYRANTKYFLSTTTFAQAAAGTMQAAKDLGLTDNEQNIVDCAWKAVGVVQGACAAIVDPKAVTPPTAPTSSAPPPPAASTAAASAEPAPSEPGSAAVATPSTTSGRTRVNLGQASSGCAVGAPGGRAVNLGPLAAAIAAALGLALARRGRSR